MKQVRAACISAWQVGLFSISSQKAGHSTAATHFSGADWAQSSAQKLLAPGTTAAALFGAPRELSVSASERRQPGAAASATTTIQTRVIEQVQGADRNNC